MYPSYPWKIQQKYTKIPEPNPIRSNPAGGHLGTDCRNKHSNTDEAPETPFHEFPQTSRFSRRMLRKALQQEDVQDDDFDGIRILWFLQLFLFVCCKYIYICIYIYILICKYVINVMDLWMICFLGLPFLWWQQTLLTTCKLAGKKSEIVYTQRFAGKMFLVYFWICFQRWMISFRTSWMACFFFKLYIFLVTQQENTFEPRPFDWRCYLRNEGDTNQRQHGDIYRREMCQYVIQSVVFLLFCLAYLGGGFKYVFMLTTIWGRFPFWRAYFSIGWVQPPTRYSPQMNLHWRDCHFSDRDFLLSKLSESNNCGSSYDPLRTMLHFGNVFDIYNIYIYTHILYHLVSNHQLLCTSL